MQALERNQTWSIVNSLEGNKHVGCKSGFSIKHKHDGTCDDPIGHHIF